MSARAWTLKKLNDVHPLPEGWAWVDDPSVGWHARYPGGYTVCIDASDDVVALYDGTQHFEPPRRVCLAVILASDGLDSREAMAAALAGMSDAAVLIEAVAMLRRGTVEVQP